jgi:hypothetical protein
MKQDADFDRRLYALFNETLELDELARQARLAALWTSEPELARALQSLIDADAAADDDGELTRGLHQAVARAAQSAQSAQTVELPTRIGGYEILGKLGEGGMGVVYLARREHLPDAPTVALKLIAERLRSPTARERFLGEQRSLARLEHPAVCRFIDADTLDDGRPFVVMEAVQGLAIEAWVERHEPSLQALLSLFLQLIGAVSHAHERLIVHRDIKSSNVLVTEAGQVKLLDFGIAKLMDETESSTVTVTVDRFLTPGIAAPEYFSRGEVTVGTDIYALGALLYRLLSGQDPLRFEGLKPAEIERQLLFVEPPSLSQTARGHYRTQVSRDLEAIVHKCLRKSPSDRYASVESLAVDLQRLLDGYPVSARVAPPLYRTRLFLRRNRGAALAAAVLTLALFGWALSLSLSLDEAQRQRLAAEAERDKAALVAEILEQSILEADPARRSIEFVGAREIMTAAAQRIGRLEASDPRAFAELAAVIARVELEYLRSAEALALVRRALDALQGSDDRELVNRLRLIGALAAARSDELDEAETWLEAYTTDQGPRNAAFVLVEARVLTGRARYAEAIELLRPAVESELASDPSRHIDNELRWQLADSLYRNGQRDAMTEVLTRMLEWQRASLPEQHAWVQETRMQRLPALASDRGALDREFQTLLEGNQALYGPESVSTMMVYVRYSEALSALGDALGDAQALEKASEIALALRGPEDALYLRIRLNLGLALLTAGTADALSRATTVLGETGSAVEAVYGPDASMSVHLRTALARVQLRSGDAHAALRTLSGESEAEFEQGVASATNRRWRADTLKELIESSALACASPSADQRSYCQVLSARLAALEAGLAE